MRSIVSWYQNLQINNRVGFFFIGDTNRSRVFNLGKNAMAEVERGCDPEREDRMDALPTHSELNMNGVFFGPVNAD